jgi:RNA polymerase sigma factor (TIGR02999 family)
MPAARSASDVTALLGEVAAARPGAQDRLLEAVYPELRRLARALMRRERPGHTLQPTALVHEAYLALLGGGADVPFADRVHFFATAAQAMRHVLVDHARRRAAAKRGSAATQVPFEEERGHGAAALCDVLALDDALGQLAEVDGRAARVVELRVFGGLTVGEMALELGVSKRTVDDDWAVGKMWLARALSGGTPP